MQIFGLGKSRKKQRRRQRPGSAPQQASDRDVFARGGLNSQGSLRDTDRLSPDDLEALIAQPSGPEQAGTGEGHPPPPAYLHRDEGMAAGPAPAAPREGKAPRRKKAPAKKASSVTSVMVDGYVSWANMLTGGGKKGAKKKKRRAPSGRAPGRPESHPDRMAALSQPRQPQDDRVPGQASPGFGFQNDIAPDNDRWDGQEDTAAWERELSQERGAAAPAPEPAPAPASQPGGDPFGSILQNLRGDQPDDQVAPSFEQKSSFGTSWDRQPQQAAPDTTIDLKDSASNPAPLSFDQAGASPVHERAAGRDRPEEPEADLEEGRGAFPEEYRTPPAATTIPSSEAPAASPPAGPRGQHPRHDAPSLDAFETEDDDPKAPPAQTQIEDNAEPVYEQWRAPASDGPLEQPREAVPFERPSDPLPRIVRGDRSESGEQAPPAPKKAKAVKKKKTAKRKKAAPKAAARAHQLPALREEAAPPAEIKGSGQPVPAGGPRRRKKRKSDIQRIMETVCMPVLALPALYKRLADAPTIAPTEFNFRQPILRGMIIAGFTFIGFGGWAMTAELSSAVIASGELKVFGSRKPVQHLEGGIIEEILVRNGDKVRAGDVLVKLSSTRAEARYSINQGRYDSARASLARLMAEKNGLSHIDFPQDMLARSKMSEISKILQTETTTFAARQQTLQGKTSLIEKRINQLREEIRGLEAQAKSNGRQITLLQEELKGAQDLYKEGYAPRTQILELEREIANLEGRRGEYLSAMARARQSISEAELEISQVVTEFREQLAKEIQEQERTVFELQSELGATSDTLQRTEIKAPASGVVVAMSIHGRETVINPGQVLMEIVPDADTLVVEARVMPKDRHKVYESLEADVMLTALSQHSTAKMVGNVIYLSADRITDERTGQPYYVAQVEIDESELKNLGDVELKPGMPADIFIKTGSRTPFNYLVSPLTESLGRAWKES